MRAHKTKLERLNKSIREPERIRMLVEYSDGSREGDLPLDAELSQDAERVMILNGSVVLGYWLPAGCWLAL